MIKLGTALYKDRKHVLIYFQGKDYKNLNSLDFIISSL